MRHVEGKERKDLILSLDKMIDEASEVYFIDKFVDHIFLKYPEKYNRKTKARGRKSFDNKIFFKLHLYCYLNGIRGSRTIERESYRNLELIWLLKDLHPDYWLINNFRSTNKELIKDLSKELKLFLKEFDYIDDGFTAYDGTKIKADASKESLISLSGIRNKLFKRVEKVEKYLESCKDLDDLENLEKILEAYQKTPDIFDLEIQRNLRKILELRNKEEIIKLELKKKEKI